MWKILLQHSAVWHKRGLWNKTEKVDTLVLATHGMIKKTGKTPEKEIKKAENIRLRYFELKNERNEK